MNLQEARKLAGLPQLNEIINSKLIDKFHDMMDMNKISADDREAVLGLMKRAYTLGTQARVNEALLQEWGTKQLANGKWVVTDGHGGELPGYGQFDDEKGAKDKIAFLSRPAKDWK